MTHKSLVNDLNAIIETVRERRGLKPGTGVKGGQIEVAQSLVGLALTQLREEILTAAGAPTPAPVIAPAAETEAA